MNDDDCAYDLLWQERFNQPLPMLGAGEIVRRILMDDGVHPNRINAALVKSRGMTYET